MALPSTTTTTAAPAPTRDPVVERLQEENESLKTQLALERLQSQSLQVRLSALESKFGRLERLLSQDALASTTTETAGQVSREEGAQGRSTVTEKVGSTETDSSRLVAREDDISLPRKLSHPSFLPSPPPSTSTPPLASLSTSTPSSPSTLAHLLSLIHI